MKNQAARRTLWRFSLRELMLVMLAGGALLAWGRELYKSRKPYSPTPAVQYFVQDLQRDIQAASAEFNTAQAQELLGWGANVENPYIPGEHREIWSYQRLSTERSREFMEALFLRIRDQVVKRGCSFVYNGGTRNDDWAYYLHYRMGDVTGVINLHLVTKGDDHVCVVATLDEQKP